jgi:hypothetical protein
MVGRCKLLVVAGMLCALVGATAPSAQAAETRSCRPIVDPYPNTRFEGVDIRRIRATEVSCTTARRVARRAHRKALGLTPPPSGIRRFTWNGWQVVGDLRGPTDHYRAAHGERRVRWVF